MRRFSRDTIRYVPGDGALALMSLVSSVPFVFLTIFFIVNEHALKAATGYGVLDFELAWTPRMMQRIFAAWGPVEMRYQAFATRVDYFYLAAYGLFGALLMLLVARRLKGRLQGIGFFMALTPILAAAFDSVENVFLLSALNRPFDLRAADTSLASLCSTFKIVFIIGFLGFLFAAVLLLLLGRLGVRGAWLYPPLVAAGIFVVWLLSGWKLYLGLVCATVYFAIVLLVAWTERGDSRRESPS
ncbi:MAG: hypothetical protein V1748_05935 [Actinomycetota bacterium]